MDSINREQADETSGDLSGREAVDTIQELVSRAETCFFCTTPASSKSTGTRPMNVRDVDDAGNFWFLSASDSYKNADLERDSAVTLYLQASAHSGFLHLRGTATVSRDKVRITELWNPMIKTWFTEGVDDPRITVIKVEPSEGYYWDNKHGNAVAGIKMLIGAAIGRTMDDSIEGRLSV